MDEVSNTGDLSADCDDIENKSDVSDTCFTKSVGSSSSTCFEMSSHTEDVESRVCTHIIFFSFLISSPEFMHSVVYPAWLQAL